MGLEPADRELVHTAWCGTIVKWRACRELRNSDDISINELADLYRVFTRAVEDRWGFTRRETDIAVLGPGLSGEEL